MLTDVQPTSARLALTIDGSVWGLPASRVLSVGSTAAVAALPLAEAGIAGLTNSAQGPVLLLDHAAGTPAGSMHQVVVDSPIGPLALWVSALRPLAVSEPDLPALDEYLQTRTGALGPARARPVRAAETRDTRTSRETFLHVRSGHSEAVLPATSVLRVGRHGGRRRLGAGTPATWLVALDDELVTTRSLAERAPQNHEVAEETWCVRLAGDAQASGLLAAEVLGFLEAPRAQIRLLRDSTGASTWLLREGEPPLEVLAAGEPTEPAAVTVDSPASTSLRRIGATPRAPGAAGALRLQLGPWRLGLPASCVQEVLGRFDAGTLSQNRSRRATPVLDLRRLKDTTRQATPRKGDPDAAAWSVRAQFGGRPIILLADFLEAASADPAWSPAPALPKSLAPLIQAVRLDAGGCELLLAPGAARAARHPRVRAFLRQAFAGWLPPSH